MRSRPLRVVFSSGSLVARCPARLPVDRAVIRLRGLPRRGTARAGRCPMRSVPSSHSTIRRPTRISSSCPTTWLRKSWINARLRRGRLRVAVAYSRATRLLESASDSGRTGPGGWSVGRTGTAPWTGHTGAASPAGAVRMCARSDSLFHSLPTQYGGVRRVFARCTPKLSAGEGIAAAELVRRFDRPHASNPAPRSGPLEDIVVAHAGEATVRAEPFDAIEFGLRELSGRLTSPAVLPAARAHSHLGHRPTANHPPPNVILHRRRQYPRRGPGRREDPM